MNASQGVPHNPYVNAGAIVTLAYIKQRSEASKRFSYMSARYKEMAGDEAVGYSNATYLSEKDSGFRNYALTYYMMAHNVRSRQPI